MKIIDLIGQRTPLELPLSEDAQATLLRHGIKAQSVLLLLHPATPRELEQLAIDKLHPPANGPAEIAWYKRLMLRRTAEGTDPRIIDELLRDMTPTARTFFLFAYTEGRWPDPKAQAAMQDQIGLLIAAASPATVPSSPTSTASTKTS